MVNFPSGLVSDRAIAVGVATAAGVVASDRVPVIFTGLTSGGGASSVVPPLVGSKLLVIFLELMVLGRFNVGLVLNHACSLHFMCPIPWNIGDVIISCILAPVAVMVYIVAA